MKIAFLFSGQGAQYPGMMKEIYDSEPAAREVFEAADRSLGREISKLCFEGAKDELNLTHNTQPCVLAADLAAGMALKARGIVPEAVAGFSLGEYAALTFAGSIPADEVFPMVQLRADAMQEAVPAGEGAMAAFIGAPADEVEKICASVKSGYIIPANYNSPVQTVVSGETAAVDEAIALGTEQGLRCMKLAVSAPFHCAMMKPAADKLAGLFVTKSFSAPQLPVYMNVNGETVSSADEIPDLLVRQAVSPVQWVRTLENMRDSGIDTFIECGPGKTLSGLVKKTLKGVTICRVDNTKTFESALETLGVG